MAKNTKIEWATATWNPFIGCTKVSPACDNCYAERWAKRCGRDFNKVVRAAPATFRAPITWKEPQRIFVCSLSDFFHPAISREDRYAAFEIMSAAPQHTYLLLTKRPENILPMLGCGANRIPDNIWIGVTVENQEQADKRIPLLLQVPAHVRFVSCEPLLGPVNLFGFNSPTWGKIPPSSFLNWVICGGESGPKARPMHPAWARSLRDQCAAAGVPFMFKQWGEWAPVDEPHKQDNIKSLAKNERWMNYAGGHGFHGEKVWRMKRVGKGAAGRLLDGREHLEIPA